MARRSESLTGKRVSRLASASLAHRIRCAAGVDAFVMHARMVYLWDEEIIVAYIAKNNTPLPPSQFIIRFVF